MAIFSSEENVLRVLFIVNVLTGRYAPAALRRVRRRALVTGLLCLAACGTLATIGLERRVAAARSLAVSIRAAEAAMIGDVLGPEPARAGAPAPQTRLTAELRQLRQTRQDDPAARDVADCAASLGALLAHWPGDLFVRTESVVVAPGSISLSASVESMGDAQRLADALGRVPGWRIRQPQSEVRRDSPALHFRGRKRGQSPARRERPVAAHEGERKGTVPCGDSPRRGATAA
jgi:hypothetical protein